MVTKGNKYYWLHPRQAQRIFILEKKQIGIKTNSLEYGGFILTVKLFLDDKEKSHYNLTRPTNCLINSNLSKDKKVYQIYIDVWGRVQNTGPQKVMTSYTTTIDDASV